MIQIHDDAGLLTGAARAQVEAAAAAWPFTTHVLLRSTGSHAALDAAAHQAVTAADVVVIAVDPTAHRTVTHFGSGAHVRRADWDAITAAGGPAFRQGDWAAGLVAIGDRAAASTRSTAAVTVLSTDPVESTTGLWIGLGVVVALLVAAVWWVARRQRRQERALLAAQASLYEESASRTQQRLDAAAAADFDARLAQRVALPVSAPYVPAPAASSSDFTNGLLLGTLLTDREPAYRRPDPEPSYSVSSDSGGSSSDWAGSDSGGSSSDWGGSSSDWGGSSSDWGGSDSGGGGSDSW